MACFLLQEALFFFKKKRSYENRRETFGNVKDKRGKETEVNGRGEKINVYHRMDENITENPVLYNH